MRIRAVVAAALAYLVPISSLAQPTPPAPPTVVDVPIIRPRARGPRTLPFVEGGRVPEGYVLRDRSGVWAIAGGASVFGLSYVLTLLVYAVVTEGCGGGDAPCATGFWPSLFPAFGPLVTIATARAGGGTATALLIDAVFQNAGIGLVIYGLAIEKFFWVRADLAGLRLAPVAFASGGRGLALAGDF